MPDLSVMPGLSVMPDLIGHLVEDYRVWSVPVRFNFQPGAMLHEKTDLVAEYQEGKRDCPTFEDSTGATFPGIC